MIRARTPLRGLRDAMLLLLLATMVGAATRLTGLPLDLGTGLGLVVLLWGGRRALPAVALGMFALHAIDVGWSPAAPLAAIRDLSSAWFAFELLRLVPRFDPSLACERDVLSLLVAVAIGSVLGSLAGLAPSLVWSKGVTDQAVPMLGDSWPPRAIDGSLVSALLLSLRGRSGDAAPLRGLRRRCEFAAANLVVVVGAVVHLTGLFPRSEVMYYAGLAWLSLRFGVAGAALGAGVLFVTWRSLDSGFLAAPFAMLIAAGVVVTALLAGVAADRVRARANRVRETLDTHQAMLRACPVASATMDLRGRIRTFNPAAERLFGFSEREVQGQPPPIVPAEKEREFQFIRTTLRDGGQLPPMETVRLRRDGSLVSVRLSTAPLHDTAGRITGVVALFEDLTERQQAEAARAQLADILQATTDFVAVMDPNYRVTYINRAGRRMVGLGETGALDELTFADLIPDVLMGRTFEEIFPSAEREGVWSGEMALCHRDGHSIPVLQLVLGHRSTDGRLQFYSTISRDLSERMEAESALRDAEAQLRQAQKMEAIGRLAGGIAHDFNNLLTIMLGFSDLALTKLGKGHAAEPDVREVHKACERAAALTSKLLAFSRKQENEQRVVDIDGLLPGLEAMLRRLLGESITLSERLNGNASLIQADPSQIEQIVFNLAVNARDAMPEGGELAIETTNVEVERDTLLTPAVGEANPGSYVRLLVKDTGVGMSRETQARIFEPFFTTKGPTQGTGLGLSTVYGIVKQSGGFVTLDSVENQGTTISIFLPRVSQSGEHMVSHWEDRASRGGHETILLVEDEAALRELARRVLSARGYRVLVAADAEAALSLSARYEGTIELLLTDVVMPGRPGPLLARQLRSERPGLRVLFMSGYADDALRAMMKLDPLAVLLPKPFLPNTLAQRVREVLDTVPDYAEKSAEARAT